MIVPKEQNTFPATPTKYRFCEWKLSHKIITLYAVKLMLQF